MKNTFALVLIACLACNTAFADDGDLVNAFGDEGLALLGVTDAYGATAAGPVIGADGSLTYCATRETLGNRNFVVARLKADGTPDPTFSSDGKVTIDFSGADDECTAIALQADGRIVVAGSSDNGPLRTFALARVNTNGTLDSTFGVSGRQQIQFDIYGADISEAHALALLPNGNILVAGYLFISPEKDFAIARLLPDGSYDTSFNLTGRQRVAFVFGEQEDASANALAVDAAGRIVLGGYASTHYGQPVNQDFAVARLLPEGAIDTTFGTDGRITHGFDIGGPGAHNADTAYAMALQPDGKIVLAGDANISATDTPNFDFAIMRLTSTGALDSAFGTGGRVLVPFDRFPSALDTARALLLDNGNLVVSGYAMTEANTGADIALLRLRANGSRDPAFGNLGRLTIDLGLTNPGIQVASGLAARGNRLFLAGVAVPSTDAGDAYVAALERDSLFDYGFE